MTTANRNPSDVLKAALAHPLVGIPGSYAKPVTIRKADDRPDHQSPDIKTSNAWDEATRKRWSPLSDLPGFVAIRGDLEFLNACGMSTGLVNGIAAIKVADLGRAKSLLTAR